MRDLSKVELLRDIQAENRAIVKRFGAKLAWEIFGVTDSMPIAPIKVPAVKLDLDAILALQSLQGISRQEAQKQVTRAQQMRPNGSTSELVTLCLNGEK